MLDVNRSGFYKWKSRKIKVNRYEQDRDILGELLKSEHKRHPSYGYHRLASRIRITTGWLISDSTIHKTCKYLGIKSKVKHYKAANKGMDLCFRYL